MADAAPKSEGRKGARKHTGLGRGLGALIPQASEQTPHNGPSAPSRPLDVFFPEGSSAGKRGGSAKDLLQPKRGTASSKKKRPSMPPLKRPVDDAVVALVAPSAVESTAQIPARRWRVCPRRVHP